MNKKIHLPNFSSRENRWVKNILLFFIIISLVAGNLFFLSQDSNISASPAIIFQDGFESGNFSAWTNTRSVNGTVTVEQLNPHSGSYNEKSDITSGGSSGAQAYKSVSANDLYVRTYVKFEELVTEGNVATVIEIDDNTSFGGVTIRSAQIYNDAGTVEWAIGYHDGGVNKRATTTANPPTTDTWYCVEFRIKLSSAGGQTDGYHELWVDGNSVLSVSNIDTVVTNIGYVMIGRNRDNLSNTSIGTSFHDCIVFSDAYIGPETAESIDVFATVSSWVSLQVSPTSTTIAPELVTAAGGVNIGESDYIQITGGTNNANGYSLDIKSLNAALCHSEGCATGTISSATATLVAGVDGYGSQATSSDGDVSIDAAYDYSTSTNDVGGMETTDQDLADTTGPSSDDITWLTFKAAATSTKPSGAYLDIITLTLIGGS